MTLWLLLMFTSLTTGTSAALTAGSASELSPVNPVIDSSVRGDTLSKAAQTPEIDRMIEQIWADAYSEEELAQAALETEQLFELLGQPLSVNSAETDELMTIPGMTLEIAQSIVQYRTDVKPFETLGELVLVSGIGQVTFQRIAPFLTVDRSMRGTAGILLHPRYWLHGLRTEVLTHMRSTLQVQEGSLRPDSAGGYLGSPLQYYHRIHLSSNHMSVNLTQEKDAGEPLTGLHDFDYRSWHLAVKRTGRISMLVAGDFAVRYGQGLLISTGGGMGKSGVLQRRTGRGEPIIRPWKSAREGGAFRGIGFTAGRTLQLSGFVSHRSHTAGMNADSTFRKPVQTGLHRTYAERERKHQLTQTVTGGHLRFRNATLEAGFTGLYSSFDAPVTLGTTGAAVFERTEQNHIAAGADFRAILGDWILFGEAGFGQAAFSNDRSKALVSGAGYQSENVQWLLLYRSYAPRELSLFGGGFAMSGSGTNERGFFMALSIQSGPRSSWEITMDQVEFPQARFRNSRPSSAWEAALQGVFELQKGILVTSRIRYKESGVDVQARDFMGREIRHPGFASRWNFRVQLEWAGEIGVRFRIRAEGTITTAQEFAEQTGFTEIAGITGSILHAGSAYYSGGGSDSGSASHAGSSYYAAGPSLGTIESTPSQGFLLFQDLRWQILPSLQLDARITFFDADSYDARLYQHENDLLYLMSSTVLFDKGSRAAFLLRLDLWDTLQLRIKLAVTRYLNRDVIGSGLQQIQGSRKTDAGIQLRLVF